MKYKLETLKKELATATAADDLAFLYDKGSELITKSPEINKLLIMQLSNSRDIADLLKAQRDETYKHLCRKSFI